jgi:hypothetical protein
MPMLKALNVFLIFQFNRFAFGIGAAQPGFNTHKIGAGLGPNA